MANRWGIPKEVEDIVKARDKSCLYCNIEFTESNTDRRKKPSWEHIVNDIRINDVDNIALCCMSCNASKGSKLLKEWLDSKYCQEKGINLDAPLPRESFAWSTNLQHSTQSTTKTHPSRSN